MDSNRLKKMGEFPPGWGASEERNSRLSKQKKMPTKERQDRNPLNEKMSVHYKDKTGGAVLRRIKAPPVHEGFLEGKKKDDPNQDGPWKKGATL